LQGCLRREVKEELPKLKLGRLRLFETMTIPQGNHLSGAAQLYVLRVYLRRRLGFWTTKWTQPAEIALRPFAAPVARQKEAYLL
jgi:hypothetical protein